MDAQGCLGHAEAQRLRANPSYLPCDIDLLDEFGLAGIVGA